MVKPFEKGFVEIDVPNIAMWIKKIKKNVFRMETPEGS